MKSLSSRTPTDTREAILDASERLLAKGGYKKMTIDELARTVGIGKGSVYLHFSSKEEIALSHIDRIIERLKAKMQTIADGRGHPAERLRQMLCLRVLHRFDSIQEYADTLNEMLASLRPGLLKRRSRHFTEEAALLERVIVEGQQTGDFAQGDAEDLAKTLVIASNSLLPFSLSTYELGERKAVEKAVKKVTDLLIRGLRA